MLINHMLAELKYVNNGFFPKLTGGQSYSFGLLDKELSSVPSGRYRGFYQINFTENPILKGSAILLSARQLFRNDKLEIVGHDAILEFLKSFK